MESASANWHGQESPTITLTSETLTFFAICDRVAIAPINYPSTP